MNSRAEYDDFVERVRDAPEPYEVAKRFVTVVGDGGWNPAVEKSLFAIWLGFLDRFDGRGPDNTGEASSDMRRCAAEWLALPSGDSEALQAYIEHWTNAYGPPSWH